MALHQARPQKRRAARPRPRRAAVLSFAAGVAIERIVFAPIKNAPVLSHVIVFIALFSVFNSLARPR